VDEAAAFALRAIIASCCYCCMHAGCHACACVTIVADLRACVCLLLICQDAQPRDDKGR
jgi:hypothetical protein